MKLFRIMSGLLDRVAVVLGAFAGSQIPAFIQQYTQRLAGHVDELNRMLESMRQAAAYSGKTLDQYIQKFLSSSDVDFFQQGKIIYEMVDRWETLSRALYHLSESSAWSRPYIFLKEMQYDVMKSTLMTFQPSLVLTIEGLSYTLVGVLIGYSTYQLIAKCIEIVWQSIFKERFRKPQVS